MGIYAFIFQFLVVILVVVGVFLFCCRKPERFVDLAKGLVVLVAIVVFAVSAASAETIYEKNEFYTAKIVDGEIVKAKANGKEVRILHIEVIDIDLYSGWLVCQAKEDHSLHCVELGTFDADVGQVFTLVVTPDRTEGKIVEIPDAIYVVPINEY